ncbi:hypothetical protein MASR2M54_09690 [Aliarcobacter cryaerophilus]
MIYERPKYKNQYENFIGGEWIAPSSGEYIENISPVDGKLLTKIPRSNEKDVDLAVEAAKKVLKSLSIHRLLKEVLY